VPASSPWSAVWANNVRQAGQTSSRWAKELAVETRSEDEIEHDLLTQLGLPR